MRGGFGLVALAAQGPDLAEHPAQLSGHVVGGAEPFLGVVGGGAGQDEPEGADAEAGDVVADRPAGEFAEGDADRVDVVGDGEGLGAVRLRGGEVRGDHGGGSTLPALRTPPRSMTLMPSRWWMTLDGFMSP